MTERKKRTIAISVEVADSLSLRADVLALKYAQTLYGVEESVVDCLSQAGQDIIALLPNVGEFKFIDSHSQIASRAILFIGVKHLSQFGYQDKREFGYRILVSLAQVAPKTKHVCLPLQGSGYGLDEAESFEAELAGLLDAIASGLFPENLNQITFVESNSERASQYSQLLSQLIPGKRVDLSGKGRPERFAEIISGRLNLAGHASALKPHIFVAMSFSDDMLDTFHYGIQGAVNVCGYLCERADLSVFTGDVVEWIKKRIATASLVIADLSQANPNVYLEVGYAWGCGTPTLLLVKDTEDLKFNVRGHRCLVYKNIIDLEESLRKELKTLDTQSIVDTMNVREVIAEIDSQHFAKYVSQMVYEVSSGDETQRTKAHELMKLALRWAFLLDLHSETRNPIYLKEAEKQLSDIYQQIPKEYHRDLTSIEMKARKYFEFESELQSRIQANDSFTREDIRRYLYEKSGDALFYGRLLEAITPAWDLTDELHTQIILFDMGKDIIDYEDDIKHGLPNVLSLFFSGCIERNKIPKNVRGAIRLANELRVSSRVLELAARLKEKALASKNLDCSPTLRETIIDHYSRIEQLLESFQ